MYEARIRIARRILRASFSENGSRAMWRPGCGLDAPLTLHFGIEPTPPRQQPATPLDIRLKSASGLGCAGCCGRGALFKFQVQGDAKRPDRSGRQWLGVPFSEKDAAAMAEDADSSFRYHYGSGCQYFWLWYFKK